MYCITPEASKGSKKQNVFILVESTDRQQASQLAFNKKKPKHASAHWKISFHQHCGKWLTIFPKLLLGTTLEQFCLWWMVTTGLHVLADSTEMLQGWESAKHQNRRQGKPVTVGGSEHGVQLSDTPNLSKLYFQGFISRSCHTSPHYFKWSSCLWNISVGGERGSPMYLHSCHHMKENLTV